MNTSGPQWQRFTPTKRFLRFSVYLLTVAAVVFSIRTIEIIPEFILDAPHQMADLLNRMWPMDTGHYSQGVHQALMETMHVATLGTIGTVFFAIPVAILASGRVVPWQPVNMSARLILVSSRSVNTLVWALLFVAVFGPGAVAGTMAIAFRSIGFVGKLLSEALDETDPGPVEALRSVGAPWFSVFIKGYWPQVLPSFWSIILFRWDINVRESAVLGLVGAGGIGMALDTALNLFYWDRVSLILFTIFAVVIAMEILVTWIRKRII
ncbi:phosphonate ABC transporter, permease protein PhnE [Desulfonatronovibrio hydrogenovorans]|uniref:phosphonate ABC transporter, permease protein PhnE n=1 Tax=Desulfonatronovibrio hydrogenovorans TaxID=53245 RepID=UPI00048A7F71|nr:phosphonate ABC transporter, permease protein PhnE [Desulfonatronovibrio hydrogenovorans]